MRRSKSDRCAPRACLHRIGLAAILLGLSAPAQAQQWASPRVVATAHSQRALGVGTDGLFMNPGGLAFPGAYFGEVGYADDLREDDRRINLSLTDSAINSLVAGGVALSYGRSRPQGPPDGDVLFEGYRIDGGLALRGGDQFGLGVVVTGYDFNRLEDGFLADDQSRDLVEVTVDVGFQWLITPQFKIGVVGQNLTNPQRNEVPLTVAAGIGLILGAFSVEGSGMWENREASDRWTASLGASYIIQELVPLRAGVLYDFEQEEVGLSGGLGIQAGRISFEAAYQSRVSNASDYRDDDERMLVGSLRVQFF